MNSSHRYTLSRNLILKKKTEIDQVLKTGQKVTGKIFNIYIYPSQRTRVAFLINKNVGSAVQRNRMKRLFREVYRINQEIFTNKEVVIYIKKSVDDFQKIFNEIKKFS